MPSMSRTMIIGHAGRDPELKYTASGVAQCQFSVAVSRNQKKPDGTWDQSTDWFNVIVWREQAERLSAQFAKGALVYCEGRLQSRQWQSDDGVKHERWELVADRVLPLDKRESAPADGWKSGKAEADGDEPW